MSPDSLRDIAEDLVVRLKAAGATEFWMGEGKNGWECKVKMRPSPSLIEVTIVQPANPKRT